MRMPSDFHELDLEDNTHRSERIQNIKNVFNEIFNYWYDKYKPDDIIEILNWGYPTLEKRIIFKTYDRITYTIDLNNKFIVELRLSNYRGENPRIKISDLTDENLRFIENHLLECKNLLDTKKYNEKEYASRINKLISLYYKEESKNDKQ